MTRKPTEKPDILEKGAPRDGQPQTCDRRLFMQFLAFGNCPEAEDLVQPLVQASVSGALYVDMNDSRGVALLSLHEDPDFFLTTLRDVLNRQPFAGLTRKPEFTMLGRTYSSGFEPDLEEALFQRPRRTVLNPRWPWAVWYPLRRSGAFARLSPQEQRDILMEHGLIGRAFGEADYAHDIRLACYGLDMHDNDFVIGLLGPRLYPLSAIVQTMRKTQQTSLYIEKLGPFFVGKAVWQSA